MIEKFANHRVAANLVMIMMILVGFWAIRVMPSSLDPPQSYPMVYVEVQWIGASAEDLETLVTTPIEQQLRTINDLRELESRTKNGSVSFTARFEYDTHMTMALHQVMQRVANFRILLLGFVPLLLIR